MDRTLRLKSLFNRCWPGLGEVIECSSRRSGTGDLRGMEKHGLGGLRREQMASRAREWGLLSPDRLIDLAGLNEEWRPGTCELFACWQALQRSPQA